MTRNQYIIAKWTGNRDFDREVEAAVKELARGYPARHHGQKPPAYVITSWRYDCALRIAPKYERIAAEQKAAAVAARDAELRAERERVLNIAENKLFWELRRKERKLWNPLWRAYQRGEKASKEALDELVACADAMLEAAKARDAAGLETGTWYAEWPSNFYEGYELHYAKEHQRSARELRDLMIA